MSKATDLVVVARDAGASGYVNAAGDTMTGTYSFGGFISLQTSDGSGYPRVNGAASSAQLGLFRSSGGSEGGFYVGGDSNQFSVWSSDFVRRMNVDQEGRVTMPYQPAFSAGYTSQNFSQSAGVALLPAFNTTRLNRGSHYSTSTGRFTAPVSGAYAFFACLAQEGAGPSQSYFSVEFYVNGSRDYIGGWADTSDGGYMKTTNQVVVSLSAGDYVEVGRELHQSCIMLGGNATNWYSYFSGHLIG